MAAKTSKGKSNPAQKMTFGKRKSGKAKKSFNKHDSSEKNYRGQGRKGN
jgi:hypothetical protein